eukprot:1161237-Pelagomonas_calceolata.AAC.6
MGQKRVWFAMGVCSERKSPGGHAEGKHRRCPPPPLSTGRAAGTCPPAAAEEQGTIACVARHGCVQ